MSCFNTVSWQFLRFCFLLLAAGVGFDSWSMTGVAWISPALQIPGGLLLCPHFCRTFHHHGCVKHKELPPCAWYFFSIIIPCIRLGFFMVCMEIPSACRYLVKTNKLERMPQSFTPFVQPIIFKIKQSFRFNTDFGAGWWKGKGRVLKTSCAFLFLCSRAARCHQCFFYLHIWNQAKHTAGNSYWPFLMLCFPLERSENYHH